MIRLRHLRLRVATESGLFGADIPFANGLVVIYADNSKGKSTCLKAILVALGLEAMLTASRDDLPLPPVLKEYVDTPHGRAKVIRSDVHLEIENGKGERVVVKRCIKGNEVHGLIAVEVGPGISKPGSYTIQEFFVGRSGDSTRELGFLNFLAAFMGWSLPIVRTFQGEERPLYLQCIFPYFFVEQQRGWATLEPPTPARFGIRELHKRVIEFLLALDANDIAMKRQAIDFELARVTQLWSTIASELRAIAKSAGGVIQRLPSNPQKEWTEDMKPLFLLPSGDDWLSAEKIEDDLRTQLSQIEGQEIPRANQVVSETQNELSEAQARLSDRQSFLARLNGALSIDQGEVRATEERISVLAEDLQRNKDARTLLRLGGSSIKDLASEKCPTCHQHVVDSLTPLAEGQAVMNLDENIRFIEDQLKTFRAVLENQRVVVEASEQRSIAVGNEVSAVRTRIRALKETLVSDGRIPSIAAIRARIQVEERIEKLEDAKSEVTKKLDSLLELSAAWIRLQATKALLPKGDTTERDTQKIRRWAELVREQLTQYGFESLKVDEIDINQNTYRPQQEGFDLPTNISASDFIRVIWSYLNGLRELSAEFKTNHPGLLVFDEPKQQSANDLSFEELLRRVSSAGTAGHQVIFATSEKQATLVPMLQGLSHTYVAFDGHILQPIEK